MFAGHLAVALAAKRAEPRVSLGGYVAAAYGLDLIWPVLVLTGVETVRVDPGNTAFTALAVGLLPFWAQWAERHRTDPACAGTRDSIG